jgi:hypothetical protein
MIKLESGYTIAPHYLKMDRTMQLMREKTFICLLTFEGFQIGWSLFNWKRATIADLDAGREAVQFLNNLDKLLK